MSKREIVHIEISANDPTQTAKFYSDLFGWEYTVDPQFDYAMFTSGNVGGGYPTVGEHMKAGTVIVYIGSDNLESDLENIKKHGGSPVGEIMPIPGMGRLVHFKDPNGNLLALWQSTPQG